jgi:hypothetical protein
LESVQQQGRVRGTLPRATPGDFSQHQMTTCLQRLLISCPTSQQGVGLQQRSHGCIHSRNMEAKKQILWVGGSSRDPR